MPAPQRSPALVRVPLAAMAVHAAFAGWLGGGELVLAAGMPTCTPPAGVGEPHSPPPTSDDGRHAAVSAVLPSRGVAAGSTFDLGIRFRMDPGWHIYWNGYNDTGLAPSITVQLPEGWTAGEARWPGPSRHLSPGNILDHVYEGEVIALIPVTVPPKAAAGSTGQLVVSIDYLVCNRECVPEEAKLEVEVPVVLKPEPEPEGVKLLDATRAAVPRPWPSSGLTAAWRGSTLEIAASEPRVEAIEFYPAKDSPEPRNLIADGRASGTTLRVAFKRLPAGSGALSGVVALRRMPTSPLPVSSSPPSSSEPPVVGAMTEFYILNLPYPGVK